MKKSQETKGITDGNTFGINYEHHKQTARLLRKEVMAQTISAGLMRIRQWLSHLKK